MKIKCKCGKLATWYYMPGENEWACCDDCVPRGCSCYEYDWRETKPEGIECDDWCWTNKTDIWEELDGKGNRLPCIEWWHVEEGWDNEN